MRRVRIREALFVSVISHSSNARPRFSPITNVFLDMDVKTGKYVSSITCHFYKGHWKLEMI
jgi:hypothetical protein